MVSDGNFATSMALLSSTFQCTHFLKQSNASFTFLILASSIKYKLWESTARSSSPSSKTAMILKSAKNWQNNTPQLTIWLWFKLIQRTDCWQAMRLSRNKLSMRKDSMKSTILLCHQAEVHWRVQLLALWNKLVQILKLLPSSPKFVCHFQAPSWKGRLLYQTK